MNSRKQKLSSKNAAAASQLQQGLKAAMSKHQQGQIQAAADHYRVLLQCAPDMPDALHYLGVAEHQLGHPQEAVRMIRRAVELAPAYVDAHNNLGNVYKELGQFEEAEASYRAALALRPEFVMAHSNLGVVLAKLKRHEEARASYQKAIDLKPDFADAWHNLGNMLSKCGRLEEALTAFRRALELAPYTPSTYEDLGNALAASQRANEALAVYRQWQAIEPDNPVIEHLIAACGGEARHTRASDGYVKDVFDRFSESFDTVLAGLDYRAPAQAGELIAELLGEPQAELQVLDAGCGTGLCAPYLKPYARHLLGMDLSQGMLDKAAQRQAYDHLEQAELSAYLAEHPAAFDLIVSTDTLIYFGVLQQVLEAAAAALRPSGHLVFTLEAGEDDCEPGYRLQLHGRYSHSESYVRRMLEDAGLSIKATRRVTLRTESHQPVVGFLFAAQRVA
ncbi:tetratricopeptide repeat protein [Kinneretia aquatilis]|uniref:tetratricopeptide repeat protein n=1 Tax=Kinneretia aquatilis TaxID=2070761 RepID=UPI0014950BE2|nr:tetratricopeptide repeat protein [Paucibacter aquatile]WIV95786.1 tetratricopeptide repeat protein [Paucibacter aquatile]